MVLCQVSSIPHRLKELKLDHDVVSVALSLEEYLHQWEGSREEVRVKFADHVYVDK